MNKILNISIVKAMVIRHLFEWRKELDRVIDSFWWPIVDLFAWGLVSSYLKQSNPAMPMIIPFFIGGTVFWSLLQNVQREISMPLLIEAWNRNLINLFTTPIRLREFIAGTMVLGLIKLSLTVSCLFVLAFILFHFNIFTLGVFLIPAIINLILIGWWIGFFVNGLILRFGYRVGPLAWAMIFVIFPFSAVFYPVSILPKWAQLISAVLPSSYIFESMRGVIFSGEFNTGYILISTLLNILYISLSILFLQQMFKYALKHARLVKLN